MPYIGRNHIAGDHTSNFKVLDDISSYTATFNGSLATIISTADETIRIPEHRFIQGQRVTYSNGGGGNIGGLTNGTAYFVTFDTANTIKLATSLANANSNTNINLSSVGSGSSHTLTAAFDGVNTTFKITHGGGSSADIVNSAQLQIAINNVIQKANLDSSYTEGFLVVDSRKIQFKTAPTADDIFWGNIIANTIDTFDIADLKIDQFTGDGVTTQFTLSRDVPNNQSVMVTLDGVVQHPSDKDTTRAYRILAEKVIEFSSPPPNPCDVQVRHLGFSGASTGDVTGFYGRTGNVVLGASDHITTGDITPRNINASGIVTASTFSGGFSGNIVGTSATFTGNLSVGGVLTYEDVTNVDSVGIITAQKDIHVGAGVSAVGVGTFGSLDIGGDVDVDGHTNLDNVSIAGVTTHNEDVWFKGATSGRDAYWDKSDDSLEFYDNAKAAFGTNSKATLRHSGTQFYISNTQGGLYLRNNNKNAILVTPTNQIWLYYNNVIKLTTETSGVNIVGTTTTGQLAITGVSTFTGAIDANGDLDVDGHTNLDNVSIAGFTTITQDLDVDGHTNLDNVSIAGLSTHSEGIFIPDDKSIRIGNTFASPDLLISSSSSSEQVVIDYARSGTGKHLRFRCTDLMFENYNGLTRIARFQGGVGVGHAELYYAGNKKFETTIKGIQVGTGVTVETNGQATFTGIVTASTYYGDGSNLSNITSTTINNNANNRVITGSGTANTLEGEANMTFDGATLTVNGTSTDTPLILTTTNASGSHMRFQKDGSNKHFIGSGGGFGLGDVDDLSLRTVDNIIFGVGTSEKLRITSWGGIHNNLSAIYGGGASNEPVVHFNGAVPSADAARGQFAFSDSAAYNQSPIARLSFVTRYNSSSGYTFMGGIEGGKENTTDSNYDGFVRIVTRKHGASNIERLRIDSDGHVQLRQDSTEGSAQQKLQWISNNGDLSAQAAWGQGSANFDFSVFRSDSQTNYPYGNFRVLTGGTSPSESLKVTVGGQVLKPRNPAFRAQGNTHYPNQTSGVDLIYNNEIFDKGSNYNPSNGRFTAPVSGTYFFYYCFLVYPDNDNYWKTLGFKINGSDSYSNGFGRGQRSSQESQQVSTYLDLTANDYVTPFVDISSGTLDFYMTGGHAHFFGYLVS